MPPSAPPTGITSAELRAWSNASVISGFSCEPRDQIVLSGASPSAIHFQRQLGAKKDLKGGMTTRWLKEDPRKDTRKAYSKALAVLEGQAEKK